LRTDGVNDLERRILTLVHTPDGEPYQQDAEGAVWRLYRFIENTKTYETIEGPTQAYEAARAFGQFQALLADLEGPRLHETIPRFHDTPHRYLALEDAIRNDSHDRSAGAAREIEFARSRRRSCGALHDLWQEGRIPERVVHNDAKLSNVLFDVNSGKGICVIDLDTVMPGLSLHDFGDMVRTMTTRVSEDEPDPAKITLDLSLFEAVAQGYLESTATMLTGEERRHLVMAGRLITLEQGVRFLTDHLQGDIYYHTARPHHNLDRCRTQFKLVELIEQSTTQMLISSMRKGRRRNRGPTNARPRVLHLQDLATGPFKHRDGDRVTTRLEDDLPRSLARAVQAVMVDDHVRANAEAAAVV
jgi:hypothetical protein